MVLCIGWFGDYQLPTPDADVVVLAGDIDLGRDGRKWARSHFRDKPVVYVLGNHEFYRHALPELTETLKRETDGSLIHMLENSAVELDGWTFLGCTLWSDFLFGWRSRWLDVRGGTNHVGLCDN